MRYLLAFFMVMMLAVPVLADSPYDFCQSVPDELKMRCFEKVMDQQMALLKAQERQVEAMHQNELEIAKMQASGQLALGLGFAPFRNQPIILPPVPIPPPRTFVPY